VHGDGDQGIARLRFVGQLVFGNAKRVARRERRRKRVGRG
jgi:hypothetical protein